MSYIKTTTARTLIFFLFLLPLVSCRTVEKEKSGAAIRLNQLGYYPRSVKKVVVVNTKSTKFQIKTVEGNTVYEYILTKGKYWDKSGENVKIADFSDFSLPGKYFLSVKDAPPGHIFEISDDLYSSAFRAALKSFYYIRSGIDIEEKYGGKWSRKGGHPDTLCFFHKSAQRGKGFAPSPKGWYDAGDYNKYVVNGGISVGTLLALYEMCPGIAGDMFAEIPESGNGIPDILDEVKYELDWLLTMQTRTGAANMKLTSKTFSRFVMPDKDTLKRYFVGTGTAPALNLAATTAMAARIYKSYDAGFADRCLKTAEKAWKWAVENSDVPFENPDDISTGEYGDTDFTEEFWWAASELYLTTGDELYENYLLTRKPYLTFAAGENWRTFLGNLGSFSLLVSAKKIPSSLKKTLNAKLFSTADTLLKIAGTIPYRIPVDNFVWGSNSDILDAAMVLAYAYKLSGNKKYLYGVIETTDYIFGKNATGYSFMTGFGGKTPIHVHNRICASDGIVEPIPGLIVGGPNSQRQDVAAGVTYPSGFEAKSYVDAEASYASNETAINWDAPAVFVLGFLTECSSVSRGR